MKKILSIYPLLAVIVLFMTGCLKDTGFEDNKYGINDPDNSPAAVGFNLGLSQKSVFGINAVATSQDIPIVVNYTGPVNHPDIIVKLVAENILVTNYNDSNGTATEIPTATQASYPLTLTIPAGQRFGVLKINVPNATVLDATVEYGLGIKIVSADNGTKVASNLDELFVAFNIKNKYDGKYTSKWSFQGWAAYGISDGPTVYTLSNFNLVTSGAASVTFDNAQTDDLQPAWTNVGGLTLFGATAPEIRFDLTTDKVVDVRNLTPDDGRGRAFLLNPAVTTSAFDPATHNIIVSYLMKQNGRPDQTINATFTYVGPRD